MRSRTIAFTASRTAARTALLTTLAGFAFLAAAFAFTPPAHGQVFSSTPYVAAPDPAVEALRTRMNSLEGDLKTATDRAEKLGFDLAQARKTAEEAKAALQASDDRIAALTARIDALEALARGDTAAAGAAGTVRSAEATVNLLPVQQANAVQLVNKIDPSTLPQDEEGLLKESRNLLLNGDYPSAQAGAASFLSKFPKSASAHEAQFLVAESLLLQNSYGEAVAAYQDLLNKYPNSSNGPTALVKLSRSLRLMGNKAKACQVLELMPKQFPKATPAAKQLASTERDRASCKS